jgi:hypothetical protein
VSSGLQPAAAAELSLLPEELTSALPAEALLSAVDMLAMVALEAMSYSDMANAIAMTPRRSSSSSKQSAGQLLATQEHVPFMVSLLLTAQKCATALRGACPKLALEVAATVGRNRIDFSSNAGSGAWRQGKTDAPKSAAELRRLCMKLGSTELRTRLQAMLAKTASTADKVREIQAFLGSADDDTLEALLAELTSEELKALLSWFPTEAADKDLLPNGRRIGRFADAEVIAAGPLVTFRPGGMNTSSSGSSSSSSSGGSSSWYTDDLIMLMTPWLTVGARSMWLMGQTLSELLPGGSSSSMQGAQQQRPASAHPAEVSMVDAAFVERLLELAHACVEYLGSQLCHMQLPGDDTAADGSSNNGSGADGSAASMPLLTKLLEQHAELQTGLYLAVQRCAIARQPAARTFDISSAGAAALVQRVWGDSLPGQLSAFGAAVTAALPVGWACNNAACTNLAKLSELQLVRGKAKVCGGCKLVRMCSAECQRQHWKAGHKLVCKKLAAAAAAAEATHGSNTAAGGSSSNISSSATAAAAAGVELPSSAAAAAALPVRQLKALLTALGVAGLAGAVEKSDLVGLLVGHLALS